MSPNTNAGGHFSAQVQHDPTRSDLIMVLVDASDSMGHETWRGKNTVDAQGRTPIQAVRDSLPELARELSALRFQNLTIAVATFNGPSASPRIHWLHPTRTGGAENQSRFHAASAWTLGALPDITATDMTPVEAAVSRGFDAMRAELDRLKALGRRPRFIPSIFLLTDGDPNESDNIEAIRSRVLDEIEHRDWSRSPIHFYAMGTHGADMAKLERMSNGAHFNLSQHPVSEFVRVVTLVSGVADVASDAPPWDRRTRIIAQYPNAGY